jgi:hypothetical protein
MKVSRPFLKKEILSFKDNDRVKAFLLMFAFLFAFLGCTSVRYTSSGRIPLYLSPRPDALEYFEVNGRHRIYAYGQLPYHEVIELDTVILNLGFENAANVKVHESRTFNDWLKAVLSLGLYTPLSYSITGFGKREIDGDTLEGERRWLK